MQETQTIRSKINNYSNLLMLLTSVHHVYGGIIYHTPWRFHILFFSIPVIIATIILNKYIYKSAEPIRKYLFWINWSIILIASILLIGVFEGLYNHILKNVLYFLKIPGIDMASLFPNGMYEMPNDVFFELTGILQGILAILLIRLFIKLTKIVI